jgi:NAD(P)-dependent dehydrogenase (short-subunit alcohol dehydrogenase family)
MTFDLQLENKRAVVSGGTKGIGLAVVEVLRSRREGRHQRQVASR